ncbi:MAG: ribonuclease III [Lachnospiraceae bacterium]|nr:ribonuclease III [Lachnospiraceae bacterium]
MNRLNGYQELETKIGYVFHDQSLLKMALTHSSFSNELKLNKTENYERLEFLGDAVLELSVSEYLYDNNPGMHEGNMTKLRASLVCEPTLAFCAREAFSLGDYLLLGKGEEMTGGRNRDSIVSDVFEAIIGAIYLDGGFAPAKKFVERFVLTDMEKKIEFTDSKTLLQEIVQENGKELHYELLEEIGPAHDREYVVRALIDGVERSRGRGRTKKGAEQMAAYEILKELHRI